MKKPRRRMALLAALAALLLAPGWLRAYTVAGSSDAPTLVLGDLVVVNHLAYGLTVPYTGRTLVPWGAPERGDMVLFHVPNRGYAGFKRVVGVPGDVVEVRESRLLVNGRLLDHEPLDARDFAWMPARNGVGSVIERETAPGGYAHAITYTPGASPLRNHGPVRVPAGRYFLLGDHRDNSNDSRTFGPVPRALIRGELAVVVKRGR